MKKIKIVTDSTVDISQSVIQRHGIEVVPLSFSINGVNYVDGIDITPEQFIQKMKQSNELPKSSQPAAGEFLERYNRLHEEGYEIISIHMTGSMSGTVRSAEMAAEMSSAKVTVIDSQYISKGLSFQVLEAAAWAAEGKSTSEIVDRLTEIRNQTKLYVAVDTLENLVKGGRIGKSKGLIGSLLHIKPIAMLSDGKYTPVINLRSHAQIVRHLAKQFAEDVKGKTIHKVGIAHAEGHKLAEQLKEAIMELTGHSDIDISYTSPIISTHTGVGAIGFMYYYG
ncbi:DegV family protein [Paenibacillus shunpengii]|uniref:DegV family protein n=1 Tax=Paenibacillus shunpengii TaxID=2054424 RepID=A0ABW5SIC6_9BACL|nr:DegV family protein [Paenibacillus sp. FSL H7-0326]OMC71876.1 fatty acid-binding protein DegV [Paenibacillus sp. FSL H7-0326]